MDINPQLIEQLLLAVQSHDSNIRESSELELFSLSERYDDQVARSLLSILVDSTRPVDLRQGALFFLKIIILRTWSVGFYEYAGTPLSRELVFHIRSELLKLIADKEGKIRAAVAFFISVLVSHEVPDEWPELLDILQKSLIVSDQNENTFFLLEGTLTLLDELLNDAISETEFFKIGIDLLNSLLNLLVVVTNSSDINSWKLRILIVKCFSACIQFFVMAEEDQKDILENAAKKVVDDWSRLFIEILTTPVVGDGFNYDSLTLTIIETKIDVIAALKELQSSFSFFTDTKLQEFFYPIWQDWKSMGNFYLQINSLPEAAPQVINNVIMDQISFLQICIESNSEIRNGLNNDEILLKELIATSITYSSLPEETITFWYDDFNEFITEERDLSLDRTPRTEIIELLLSIKPPLLLSLIWKEETNPVKLESIFYLLDSVIKDISISNQKMDSIFITSLIHTITKVQESDESSPIGILLKSRALILSSTISKYFGGRIDTQSVKVRFLNNCLQIASISDFPVLKLSALIALNNFSQTLANQLKNHQNLLFTSIASLVDDSESDTPAMLVEFLLTAIKLDFESALNKSSSDILQLLFTLASKDTSNVELVTEVQEMLEELVENSTFELYAKICSDAIPLLLTNVNSSDGSFNSDLQLSLDLLGSIIDKGPKTLPDELVTSIVQPLYRIIQISTDPQILQSASEAFTYLVEHGFNKLANSNQLIDNQSGLQIILIVASKLLDPSWEDSAALASGRLVTIIINKFSAQLGDLLPQLLNATVRRLINAQNLSLVENLVSVFCLLVLQSTQEVVDILNDIQLDAHKTALQAVLVKWLSTFEYVRGYDEIKRNVVALQKLYSLNDSRVRAVITDGDLIPPRGDIIITRSKAKSLKYTRISASEKIIKLLIKELATTPSIEGLTNNQISSLADDNEDDDWEDDLTESTVPSSLLNEYTEGITSNPRQLDTETYSLILEWFKQIVFNNIGDFQTIYTHLTEIEQGILHDKVGTP